MTILPYLFRPKKANTSGNGQTITTATTAANGTTGQQQQWGDENNNHNIIKPITTTKKHKEQKQKIQHIIDTEACNQTGKETWDLSQFQLVETLGRIPRRGKEHSVSRRSNILYKVQERSEEYGWSQRLTTGRREKIEPSLVHIKPISETPMRLLHSQYIAGRT